VKTQNRKCPYSFFEGLIVGFYKCLNAIIPWHKLPKSLGVGNLLAFRIELRAKNLHDTDGPPQTDQAVPQPRPAESLYARVSEGYHNDL